MHADEFIRIRKKMSKTQVQLADLLGVSVKSVTGYEQGWRKIPAHVERQMLFLLSRLVSGLLFGDKKNRSNCWELKQCREEIRKNCPAWEYDSGVLCWFINGTVCLGTSQKNWEAKMGLCRRCIVLKKVLLEI